MPHKPKSVVTGEPMKQTVMNYGIERYWNIKWGKYSRGALINILIDIN